MFRLGWKGKEATFRPVQTHNAAVRAKLNDWSFRTLGNGNFIEAVKLPLNENLHEWLATNTVDFFNEVSLIWGLICDVITGEPQAQIGEAFPPGFEYRWAEGGKEAVRVSGPQYVSKVLTWVEAELNNTTTFPTIEGTPFPKNFEKTISTIFTRLFRVYAIIYTNYISPIESVGAAAHLNTSFKHFLLFVWEFDLVKVQEMEAVAEVVQEVQSTRCLK